MHELVKSFDPRLSWDEYFMATAFLIAGRSPCERLHVGCVIVTGGDHPNRIISTGYNGFLPGAKHTSRVRSAEDGKEHEMATVHAEQNAVADAARRGVSVAGATAYVTYYPCINCTKVLVAAGIREVKYHLDYKNDPIATELFSDAGISVVQI